MGWGGGGGLNCKISLIGSILSIKNERSCKNGGLKRVMFGLSHIHTYVHIFVLYLVILYSNIKCEGRRGRTVNSFDTARQKFVGGKMCPPASIGSSLVAIHRNNW